MGGNVNLSIPSFCMKCGERCPSMMSAQVHCRGISRRGRKLTDRQVHMMQLVSEGLTDVEIGNQLLISKHTVTMTLLRLRERLGGLRTRTQLGVEHVRRNGNREIAC